MCTGAVKVKSLFECGLEERVDHSQASDGESDKMTYRSRNEL